MKSIPQQMLVQKLFEEYDVGNISFKHRLQRPVGQWTSNMRSLFVHSLLQGYPVDSIYVEEKDGVMYTIDGTQRLYELMRFIKGEYALTRSTPDVNKEKMKDGNRYVVTEKIASKKFDGLSDDMKTALLGASLTVVFLKDYKYTEMQELFKRLNLSKPLNPKLMRVCIESEETVNAIYDLTKHEFLGKALTDKLRINGSDRDAIVQAAMLIVTQNNKDGEAFTSFRAPGMNDFIVKFDDKMPKIVESIKIACDSLEWDEDLRIPVTTLPMVLFGATETLHQQKDIKLFSEKAQEAVRGIVGDDTAFDAYRDSCKSSSCNRPNVEVRLKFWENLIKDL